MGLSDDTSPHNRRSSQRWMWAALSEQWMPHWSSIRWSSAQHDRSWSTALTNGRQGIRRPLMRLVNALSARLMRLERLKEDRVGSLWVRQMHLTPMDGHV